MGTEDFGILQIMVWVGLVVSLSLMTTAAGSSETLVHIYQTTRRQFLQGSEMPQQLSSVMRVGPLP
jgi:hypothetical protein